jgi:16S rRNA G966 N2-methylase RsmD
VTSTLADTPSLDDRASWVVLHEGVPDTLEVPTSATTTYLTHGLFRYAGKLPPPLVAYLLDRYSEIGDLVLDPMSGGGTIAVEAVSSGRNALSFDVNPVSRLITEAVSTPTDVDALARFAQQVGDSWEPATPSSELAEYFSSEAYGLLEHGLRLAETPVEMTLLLAIARPASFANTKKINTVFDPSKRPKDPDTLLADTTRRFCKGLDELKATEPADSEVGEAAAASVPVPDASADLVFLHPPYLTNTAFSESMHLQLLLLQTDPKLLRKSELAYRGSYFHVRNGLQKYMLGWARILAEAKRALRPEGHLVVVIGDGRIDKVRIPMGAITEELGGDLGMRLVERALHRLNNQTGWTLSRRMTGQHVLVFRAG